MKALQSNPVYFTAAVCEPDRAPKVDPKSARPVRLPILGHYVVELMVSDAPLRPQTVPHVDLFDVYHLYTDTRPAQGTPRHVLRLGFFSEARIAKTVARYLAMYFDSPHVIDISAAEQQRAARQRFVARKDVGATGQYAAIELTAPRPLPAVATEAPHAPLAPPSQRRSFWSRLVGARRR